MLQETQGCNGFQKINKFNFFPYKSLCDQIWPWRKMGQGQPKVIIWTTLVVLPYTMLHTKFQCHWSIGSGEEDFLRFLPYMGSHLGHMTKTVWTTFRSPDPWRLHIKFGYNWPSSFRGEVIWNCGRMTTTDNEAFPSYKLPWSLRLRWAKNQV